MYLKSGLAKAYVGCREGMFERDVKHFGHRFQALASEIAFPATEQNQSDFAALSQLVVATARYPIKPLASADYTAAVNERTQFMWDRLLFFRLCGLAEAVRRHVVAIDNDKANSASHHSYRIDADGYMAFRVGGHLPPRITYRCSTEQVAAGETKPHNMRDLVRREGLALIEQWWDDCMLSEDAEKKTFVRHMR